MPVTGTARQSRRLQALLTLGWIGGLVGLLIWLRTPALLLREHLKVLQFWSLEVCFVLVLALGLVAGRDACRLFGRSDVLRMAALALLAVGLTVFVAPRTNRIYYDEQIYQSVGQNLGDLRLAQMCHDGTVEYGRLQCWSGEYNKQPYAYPHLLSVAYRLFGVSGSAAFAVNALVMALTVCGIYLLAVTLFEDRTAAFFAALVLSLTPQQLLWSATAAVEPSASLACVAALLFASWFRQFRTTAALAGAGVAAAYAVQFRPESFLILPAIALLVWPAIRDEAGRPRLWAVGLLVLALIAVPVAHISAVQNEAWGATGARLSFAYLLDNLGTNGGFYLGDGRFPLLYTAVAVAGLAGWRFQRERLALMIYFLSFFGIYLLFYAGSYNYGADVRYSLMTYPPICVLGGLGLSRVVGWAERVGPGRAAFHVVAAIVGFQFLWYAPVVRATTEEAWAARADVRFAASLAPELPANAYVLTHNPGMFHVWGVNAGQMSQITTSPLSLNFLTLRYAGGGVYLHWNYWCNVKDPVQQGFCRKALEGQSTELVREYRERDQRFALYRFPSPARPE